MNMLRKKVYRVLYEILNCLSVRWDWRWINDSKIFFGTALVILSVGESKKGQAAERKVIPSISERAAVSKNEIEYFVSTDSTGKLRVDTIRENEEFMFCYVTLGDEVEDSLTVYAVVSDMPVFPGDLKRYVKENVRYPEEAIKQGITGKVFVSAIIEKDGRMDSIEVAYGKHPLLKAEALRLVKKMPRWEPGRHQGELKRVSVVIPVNFTREMLDSLQNKNGIFCYVTEEMPVFPHKSLQEYIAERIEYPIEAREQKIEGKVVLL